MSSRDRRAAARRRAWGRGPIILRFEPLEGRQLLTLAGPDLIATQFSTVSTADWGDPIEATGIIYNRGTATTGAPVEVDIYASSTPLLTTPGAVTTALGSAVIPAGLTPGASYKFDQIVHLPPSTTAGASKAQPLYITLKVDPYANVAEINTLDKQGLGLGVDTSELTIGSHQPADLVGTSFSVTPTSEATPGIISWGDTFNVVEQIKNNGQGNAPPSRARIVLTPAGATPGGYSDVTIGDIAVPAIPAFQSTNVVQSLTLPAIEPTTLAGATSFTISVVQDGDFLTQPVYPQVADQGVGLDQGPIGIQPGPAAAVTPPASLPDLAPASVVVSSSSLAWGQSFQVGTVVQNVGPGASGPFRVRFVAAGVSGDLSHGIFLGDVNVAAGLPAGGSVNILAPATLPSKLPYGTSLASPAYSQVYAIVDPEDSVDEATRGNNMAPSAPVLLTAIKPDGSEPSTVPTYSQNIYTVPALAAKAAKATKTTKVGTAKPAAAKPAKKHKVDLLASISESIIGGVEKQIKALPSNINKALKDIGFNGQSSGTTATAATTTTSQAAVTSAAAAAGVTSTAATTAATGTASAASNNGFGGTTGGSGGFGASGVTSPATTNVASNGVTISSSGFGTNNTSGGDGGFAASGTT